MKHGKGVTQNAENKIIGTWVKDKIDGSCKIVFLHNCEECKRNGVGNHWEEIIYEADANKESLLD